MVCTYINKYYGVTRCASAFSEHSGKLLPDYIIVYRMNYSNQPTPAHSVQTNNSLWSRKAEWKLGNNPSIY